jgi:hypothetical protein
MKAISILVLTLAVFNSFTQTVFAEGNNYLMNVKLKTVLGTALNDFRVDQTIQLRGVVTDDPSTYGLKNITYSGQHDDEKFSSLSFLRDFEPTDTLMNFNSPSFFKNWKGVKDSNISSSIEFKQYLPGFISKSMVFFTSSTGNEKYMHIAEINLRNSLQNFKLGAREGYSFRAAILSASNRKFHYFVEGDIESFDKCDKNCESMNLIGIPNN